MKKILVLLLLTSVMSVNIFRAAAEPEPTLWSLRSMGMGGAGVAFPKDDDSFIMNPAGLSYVKRFKTCSNVLNLGVKQSLVDEVLEIMDGGIFADLDFRHGVYPCLAASTVNPGLFNIQSFS